MAKKKSTASSSAGSFTSDSQWKISNAKGKWGQVKKMAKKVQEKAKALGYNELKDLAREYNAKLPKGSKKRINLRQSGEKISAALGIKLGSEKAPKPQPTAKKSPAKTGEAWGKTLDKIEQGESKPKLSGETKGDFRKQVQEAAKKLTADKPKVEVEKPAPKETIDGLVKAVEAKKKEIKSRVGKDKSTPEGYTRTELYNLAKDAKVPGYSKMNKQQLFDSLGIGKKEEAKKSEPVAEVKKPEPKKEEIKEPEPVAEVKKPEPKKEETTKAEIESYDDFSQEISDVHKRLNDDYGMENLVPIWRMRREMGDRVSRSDFNDWLLKMQENDHLQLIGGEMTNATQDRIEDSITTELGGKRYYAKMLNPPKKSSSGSKKPDSKKSSSKASQKPISSAKDFQDEALKVHERLDKDFGMENLVPIWRMRREIGDRVSRSDFNNWLLKMQENDEVQLIGGDLTDATQDRIEDSIRTELGGRRYYVKRLRKL